MKNPAIDDLTEKIRRLETELEAEVARHRAGLRFGMERGKAIFEEEILRRHRELQRNAVRYILDAHPLTILTAPLIYALIVPVLLLDLWIAIYQAICFPVYGIAKVKRCDYLVFDRRHLPYLNVIEKINCAYCSYAVGIISYAGEVASRTEQYWCPIKHARRMLGAHARSEAFADYGDSQAYTDGLTDFRRSLEKRT
jgi:hypothetical protein